MKVNYKELMKKMGVDRELNLYETQPWFCYDEKKGITCEGEVRCNSDRTEIEAEIQFVFDTPPKGTHPVEQACHIVAKPTSIGGDHYSITSCVIKGEEWRGKKLYDWETKACNFLRTCIRDIKSDKIPDVEAIRDKEMKDTSRHGGRGGDGSNKQPKIDASQLMYDRKGIGSGF